MQRFMKQRNYCYSNDIGVIFVNYLIKLTYKDCQHKQVLKACMGFNERPFGVKPGNSVFL